MIWRQHMATQQHQATKGRKKGPKLTQDGKITVFDMEDATYGIREIIDLIRYIPEGQDVFFGAEMIKKTLSSMQISIHDIMQDGVEKRKLAAKTIQHLVAEISDYQRRIQSLKGHIRHLRFELGEIQDTCHYLLSDDMELGQYQHILDEVPRSPIEGFDAEDELVESHLHQMDAAEKANESEESAEASDQDFKQNDTLVESTPVADEDFVPDAFKNPDEDYKEGNSEESLQNLTDEVFNPDRFDDDNGVNQNDLTIDEVSELEEESTPAPEEKDDGDEQSKNL